MLRVESGFSSSQVPSIKHSPSSDANRRRDIAVPIVASSLFLACLLGGAVSPALAAAVAGDGGGVAQGALDASEVGLGFLDRTVGPGFVQAFSLIFVSELGDKTFFIAALLSAKFSKLISFVGSVAALVVMTGISVGLGQLFHAVPSGFTNGLPLDDYVACAAFAYFGYRTLSEAYEMEDDDKGGELVDAEEALKDFDEDEADATGGGALASLRKSGAIGLIGQTFALVFAAEFGDRSFLSTIALAAAQNPASVFTGAVVAHTVATAIAVAGGAILSEYISEKVIGYIGGTLFIVFAITTAFGFF